MGNLRPLGFVLLALSTGACANAKVVGGGTGGTSSGGGTGAGGAGEGGLRDAGIALGFKLDVARGAGGATGDGGTTACKNLQCRQSNCPNGVHSTLTGTVYAPNGKLPLYNAVVYVPNAPLPAIPPGLVCDRCGVLPPGEPLVSALTDSHGVFTLSDVPDGANLPLVIQVGKWRRQVTVPSVAACTANQVTDPNLTRLPRNRSEGDMPRVAITTGPCDDLVCLMPKLGIDPNEWGIAGEDKAITFYHGATYDSDGGVTLANLFDKHLAGMTSATGLWASQTELAKYDLLILSCECTEVAATSAQFQAVTQYLGKGGRMFTTDLQYIWYPHSSDPNLAASVATVSNMNTGVSPVDLDTTFPKGKALADWMSYVNPTDAYSQVSCDQVWDNFTGVTRPAWQVWATSASMSSGNLHPRFLSANTPVNVPLEEQCGRAVHLDAHVSAAFGGQFPQGCGDALQSGEQALAFFLFDVAACIQDDTKPPVPPPPIIY